MPVKSDFERARRKAEHIRLALSTPEGPGVTGFADVLLWPEAVPDLDLDAIDLSTSFLGRRFPFPLLINALTGGTDEAARINIRLAQVAKETGLPMAVGSQQIALDHPHLAYTFAAVRRVNPRGVVFANLSAGSSPAAAERAVDMVRAEALQLHLNAAQELSMGEGERAFYWSERIRDIAAHLPVPVIGKEVGSGLTGQTAQRLLEAGVKALDIGGKGGTNFVAIENQRRRRGAGPFLQWGLPTVWSLLDVRAACPQAEVCATGGVRTGLDMAKALALGARLCGVASPLLRAVVTGGVKAGVRLVERWKKELSCALLLCGAPNLEELRKKPVLFLGDTREFVLERQRAEKSLRLPGRV
ncbi:MAG TPA: type 2 isopentenyl-diphosphate Delta-isomerase [Firmicutes bacterium]|nr:type 2 isopentenyl-diphosphate Delta-isomerase [Bacillota bacterium]